MKINHVFINQSEVIRGRVSTMPMEGCISKYFRYLDESGDAGLEKEYIAKLNCRAKPFMKKLVLDMHKDKSIDEIKDIMFSQMWEGFYGYEEKPWEDVADDINYRYSNEDLFETVKGEMIDALEELLADKALSIKEKRAKEIQVQIQHKKSTLCNMDKSKEELNKEIVQLEKTLECLED